jgi:hypothetical protein
MREVNAGRYIRIPGTLGVLPILEEGNGKMLQPFSRAGFDPFNRGKRLPEYDA